MNFQLHKAWLERRAERKRLHLQQQISKNNQTQATELWRSFYHHTNDDDLNEITKPKRMKSSSLLGLRLKSKYRNKYQKFQSSDVSPKNDSIQSPKTTAIPYETKTVNATQSTIELSTEKRIFEPKIDSITSNALLNGINSTNKPIEPIPTTTEYSITYNATVNGVTQSLNATKQRKLSNAIWGRWQKWTKCSRSCGAGVMSQSRQCLSR